MGAGNLVMNQIAGFFTAAGRIETEILFYALAFAKHKKDWSV